MGWRVAIATGLVCRLPARWRWIEAALPSGGHMSASVEDMAHFLIANLNGGRYGDELDSFAAGHRRHAQPGRAYRFAGRHRNRIYGDGLGRYSDWGR